MSLSNSTSSSGSDSVRNSVFREFSLLLKRHNSDFKVKTYEEHKEWLDHLSYKTNAKSRRKAIINISDNIDKYEKTEIPLVWVKAIDLLKTKVDGTETRMLLELLSKCCSHCGNDDSVRLTFYFTLIDMCCNMGSKVKLDRTSFDTSLDLIFSCINGLTDQGSDIMIFEQDTSLNISNFLRLCLTNILEFNTATCISFLSLLNNCLRNSAVIADGLDMIIRCAQHTPNSEVLLSCFHTTDILINIEQENISDQSAKELVYLMTGAINLNNKFNQQLLKTLDTLIESKYWSQFYCQLRILIESTGTSLSNLRGAVTILTDLALQDKEDWWIQLTILFNKGNCMYGQILECIKTLINDDHFCEQRHGYIWYNDDGICLFKILREILSVAAVRENNPITISVVYNAMLKALLLQRWELFGFRKSLDLLAFIIEYKEILSEEQKSMIAKYLKSNQDPIPKSTLVKIINILDPLEDSTAVIVQYLSMTYSSFDTDCKNLVETVIFETLSCDTCQSVFSSCASFFVVLSEFITTDTLMSYAKRYFVPEEPRRKSIVSITVEPPKFRWKLIEQSIALVRLFQRNASIFPYLIITWRHAVKLKDAAAVLVIARILMKIRIDADGLLYICEEADIDGLTTTLNRNTMINSGTIDDSYLWRYPEDGAIYYIDEKSFYKRFDADSLIFVDIAEWTQLIVETLRKPLDWELYTYVLAHLCPQLANFYLFKNDTQNIEILHDLILQQLRDGPPIKTGNGIGKSDVQLAFVRTLSSLFPYYRILGKTRADEMIKITLGILESSLEKAIIPLLHHLTVSCYEIPSSIKKHLNPLLENISIRLTKKHAIPSLLEFLIALSDSPEIISPLTLDQLKRVFTIAFKLIEVSHDLKEEAEEATFTKHSFNDEQKASFNPSTINFVVTKSMAHFYLTLSYQIISHWFIRISLSKRPLIAPFLMGKLSTLKQCDDTDAYKDLVTRFTTTDLELRVETVTSDIPHGKDPHYSHEYWYRDGKILSIEVNTTTGESLVVTRGASGNSVFDVKPLVKREPESIDLFQFKKICRPNYSNKFTPGYVLAQFTAEEDACQNMFQIEEPHLIKSIQLVDTIPVVEFHKIGLIYMAPNDTCEKDILSHILQDGSHQYKWFINELGSIIKLDENDTFYIGGLNPGTDGEYALIWHDQKCQIVFHTVSLMPNNDQDDPDRTMKKRHVGNDFINIYYDERKQDSFPFDIIKSQFNFINIVIKPMWNDKADNSVSEFYKVKIYRAKDVPGIFSTSHFKIMHKQRLAAYIRHLSTVVNTFAHIWHESASLDHCSTWSRRFAHIKSIKARLKNESHGGL